MKVDWRGNDPKMYTAQGVKEAFEDFTDEYQEDWDRFNKEHGKDPSLSGKSYFKSRIRLPKHEAKRRLVALTRVAAGNDRRTGKYSVLSAEQVWCTAGAVFFHYDWLVMRVQSMSDLLDLALDFYFAGCNVSRKLELFEKLDCRRVVLNGHGCYHPAVPDITVPHGKTIHFYVSHGRPLAESAAMAMESYSGKGSLTIPLESRSGGESVPNYFLGFPAGLKLNVRRSTGPMARTTVEQQLGSVPDNFVINLDSDRWIPLSVLLKDSRVQRSTEIHWSACRSKAPESATLKHGYLYYSMSGDSKLYGGHGKVQTLRPRH